jgi:hypothetical protein
MRARQWMKIAAIASAIGLTGTAIAHELDHNAAAQLDTTPAATAATIDANAAAQLDTAPAANTAPTYGTTQGSTMASPRSDDLRSGTSGAVTGAGSAATSIGGDDRLATTDSDDFVDAQRQGYATPGGAREIFHFGNASPAQTGSDVEAGDMGPGNARGQ